MPHPLHSDFAMSFYSSLLSSLVVAAILAAVAYGFTDLFKQPDLRLMVKQDGRYAERVHFHAKPDGSYEAEFQLAIKNVGRAPVKAGEGYWHTYMKSVSGAAPLAMSVPGDGGGHQSEVIHLVVYPQSITDIPGAEYKLIMKKGDKLDPGIRYFFSTDYGNFPRSARMNLDTGQIPFEEMGLIGYSY